jgi:hypothetical protein
MKDLKFSNIHSKLEGKCLCHVNLACKLCVFSILHVMSMCLLMRFCVNVYIGQCFWIFIPYLFEQGPCAIYYGLPSWAWVHVLGIVVEGECSCCGVSLLGWYIWCECYFEVGLWVLWNWMQFVVALSETRCNMFWM